MLSGAQTSVYYPSRGGDGTSNPAAAVQFFPIRPSVKASILNSSRHRNISAAVVAVDPRDNKTSSTTTSDGISSLFVEQMASVLFDENFSRTIVYSSERVEFRLLVTQISARYGVGSRALLDEVHQSPGTIANILPPTRSLPVTAAAAAAAAGATFSFVSSSSTLHHHGQEEIVTEDPDVESHSTTRRPHTTSERFVPSSEWKKNLFTSNNGSVLSPPSSGLSVSSLALINTDPSSLSNGEEYESVMRSDDEIHHALRDLEVRQAFSLQKHRESLYLCVEEEQIMREVIEAEYRDGLPSLDLQLTAIHELLVVWISSQKQMALLQRLLCVLREEEAHRIIVEAQAWSCKPLDDLHDPEQALLTNADGNECMVPQLRELFNGNACSCYALDVEVRWLSGIHFAPEPKTTCAFVRLVLGERTFLESECLDECRRELTFARDELHLRYQESLLRKQIEEEQEDYTYLVAYKDYTLAATTNSTEGKAQSTTMKFPLFVRLQRLQQLEEARRTVFVQAYLPFALREALEVTEQAFRLEAMSLECTCRMRWMAELLSSSDDTKTHEVGVGRHAERQCIAHDEGEAFSKICELFARGSRQILHEQEQRRTEQHHRAMDEFFPDSLIEWEKYRRNQILLLEGRLALQSGCFLRDTMQQLAVEWEAMLRSGLNNASITSGESFLATQTSTLFHSSTAGEASSITFDQIVQALCQSQDVLRQQIDFEEDRAARFMEEATELFHGVCRRYVRSVGEDGQFRERLTVQAHEELARLAVKAMETKESKLFSVRLLEPVVAMTSSRDAARNQNMAMLLLADLNEGFCQLDVLRMWWVEDLW